MSASTADPDLTATATATAELRHRRAALRCAPEEITRLTDGRDQEIRELRGRLTKTVHHVRIEGDGAPVQTSAKAD